ncbi:uncharacterized protein [Anoplolepis gracilipes]|uniref:uncharacterized protein n=1 Tax=Anoplolepis gracilipes TaxID=354296 RepID=UPI003B9E2917
MSCDLTSPLKIRKSSVEKALTMIKRKVDKKRRKDMTEIAKDRQAHYCKSFQGGRRNRTSLVGFSKSLALSEMQSYINRQDWIHALNLLPRLLEYPVELEPLVWRYMFIILLHTNDPSHLRQFFEQCIGNYNLDNGILLRRLLSLPLEE